MRIPANYNIPPTIYSLLNSYVNFYKEDKSKIKDLAKNGREMFFDFDYPLSNKVNREDFECLILKHYMMRRIGYETVTAFKLALEVKLNEIMPTYNKLFDALHEWEIFVDGEVTTRDQTSKTDATNELNSTSNNSNESDRRYSDTPQNKLEDVRNGDYISSYNYDTDKSLGEATSKGTSTDSGVLHETIKRTPANKMTNYVEFIKEKQNVYTMIFKELDVLFYQVI
jgi:hypothetical protein